MTQYVDTKIRANLTYLGDIDALERFATGLLAVAEKASTITAMWQSMPLKMQMHRHSTFCPYLPMGAPSVTPSGHTSLPFDAIEGQARTHLEQYAQLAATLQSAAERILRAYSIYSDSEQRARRIVNEMIEFAIERFPIGSSFFLAGASVFIPFIGLVDEGEFTPASYSHELWWFQDGIVSGYGSVLSGVPMSAGLKSLFKKIGSSSGKMPGGIDLSRLFDPKTLDALEWKDVVENLFHTDEANEAAGQFAKLGGSFVDRIQGSDVNVYEIHPRRPLEKPETIADAYRNIELLNGPSTSPGYATICIQRLERPDGKRAWIVTLPDSDGHPDSPCSVNQIVPLMSDSSRQRLDSESVKFAREAMKQAGVKKGDDVVLIGGSQGGLTAASMAGGISSEYDFLHVVTASAPIANHPIPGNTYVTSVEMETDPLTALDGAQNPVRESWLTVQGMNSRTPSPTSTPVEGTGDHLEQPTGMNYQRAAWQNATEAGSPAVEEHERHFQEATRGELVGTYFYQGRIE